MKPEKDIILYLDDEEVNLTGFKFVFRGDYHILTAATVREARALLAGNQVKLIISDQRMPDMLGTDFFQSIADEYPDVIKIILTAYADSDTAIKAINQTNIYQFLIKPWKKEKMSETLKNAITAYDLLKSNSDKITNLQEQNEQIQATNKQLRQEIFVRLQTERALLQSERKFRRIFDDSSDGIIIWNFNFQIIDINRAIEESIGFSREELLTMPINAIICGDSFNATTLRLEQLKVGAELPSIEYEGHCKDGSVVPVEVNSRIISLGSESAVLTMVRDIRPRKQQEKAIMDAIIDTEETERKRFARDLHDDFGPILSSIKMYLRLLNDNTENARSTEVIETIRGLVDESIAIVRTTSNALSSHVLVQYGLVSAMHNITDKFAPFVKISFTTNLTTERFAPNTEAVIYRIFNELLNNTVKHAEAKNINIQLHIESGILELRYSDDGKGFDLKNKMTDSADGIGIFNIFSRVKTIGGKYTFETAPGKGVVFSLKAKCN